MRAHPILLFGLFLASMTRALVLPAQYLPAAAFQDSSGYMHYQRDAEGNHIPDFSHAGYRGGGVPLPQVPAVMTIGPIAGDNTAHIQAAIDAVSALPPDSQGHRGALLLDTGRYEIRGTLRVSASGVVLRGVGDGADTSANTVLVGVGNTPNQRTILVVGGGSESGWTGRVPQTTAFITTQRVLVGEYSFKVEHPEYFAPGDNIVINHPCTQAWLDAVEGGGAVSEPGWAVGSYPLIFNRRIVSIDDSTLTLDVPLYNTLDRSLSPSFVYVYDRAGLVTEVGVEDLRIDIETAGGSDEAHAWNALKLAQVEDAWVQGCTFLHFGLAGVYTATATRVTIADCRATDPVAQVTGSRMYNFNLFRASSQVLVRDCYAGRGRHHYVSNGTSWVSGCVFLRCVSEAAHAASEGHRHWSMGLLYDNLQETAIRSTSLILLGLYNRGDYGTAHGWVAAHAVAWHCDMGGARLVVQKPPTAQNYAIGCQGQVSGNGPWPGQAGYIEGTDEADLVPGSLYEAQLAARLAGHEKVVTDLSGTGIEDRGLRDWRLYPNPSPGHLHLESLHPQPFRGILRDVQGRIVQTFAGQRIWLGDGSALPSGCYLVELWQDGRLYKMWWIKEYMLCGTGRPDLATSSTGSQLLRHTKMAPAIPPRQSRSLRGHRVASLLCGLCRCHRSGDLAYIRRAGESGAKRPTR
ncbi:MAG: hypothetical protein OHK0039_29140 [Bacteroidia bacterium]